jgi:beta-1,4-mannosyl-glycoprotein beta-1,4-N-acetylglucosaminyltransferase
MISKNWLISLAARMDLNRRRILLCLLSVGGLLYCAFTLPRGNKEPFELSDYSQFLPLSDTLDLCALHNLTAYPNRSHHRKIYDLFLVNTELDWLEIRLNELGPHVDYFVILEATHTFTGHPKPLCFKLNFGLFESWRPKIIYRALNLEHLNDLGSWQREAYTRNALLDEIFPSLLGPTAPEIGDVILVSDLDEIPRPETLTVLRHCQFPERTTLRSRFFYYSFQWQHIGPEWHHPQATYYQGPEKTIKPEDLWRSQAAWDLWNSSWHCSSCFSTVAETLRKIEASSHTDLDQPRFKEPAEIVRRVRNGLDLFDRKGEDYQKMDWNDDIPQYLKRNQMRFNYILDRDPPNANFRDY